MVLPIAPITGTGFSYKDKNSMRSVKSLFKSNSDVQGSAELLLVQGGSSERTDAVRASADFLVIVSP